MLVNYLCDISEYEVEKEIAKGNFSKVFIGYLKNQRDHRIAIKRIPVNSEDPDSQRFFIRELSIMVNLNHPNLIKFIGFSLPSKKKQNFEILSLFLPNKTLLEILQEDKERDDDDKILNATRKTKIVYGIASAMSYLHKNNVAHRDLKPENIFMDEDFNPIISDFGLSKFYEENGSMTSKLGTPFYMAPELFDDNLKITQKIDVYSFAVTLLALFTTDFKFYGRQPRTINQLMTNILDGKRFIIPNDVPKFYVSLINKCWSYDQKERPSFDDIVKILEEDDDFMFDGSDKEEVYDYIKKISSFDSSYVKTDVTDSDKYEEEDEEETQEFDFDF